MLCSRCKKREAVEGKKSCVRCLEARRLYAVLNPLTVESKRRRSEWSKRYHARADVRERVRVYERSPEVKSRRSTYLKAYRDRPEAKRAEAIRNEQRRESRRGYHREYNRLPAVKARKKRWGKEVGNRNQKAQYDMRKKLGLCIDCRVPSPRVRCLGCERTPHRYRMYVFERDNKTCQLCGTTVMEDAFHVDHIVPVKHGGGHEPENLRLSCIPCNLSRGSRETGHDQPRLLEV